MEEEEEYYFVLWRHKHYEGLQKPFRVWKYSAFYFLNEHDHYVAAEGNDYRALCQMADDLNQQMGET